jgi:hypothetical protein
LFNIKWKGKEYYKHDIALQETAVEKKKLEAGAYLTCESLAGVAVVAAS